MGKALVIAEKPSVARDIARALGRFRRYTSKQGEYYENDQYIIASSVGHLLELTPPEGTEDPKTKWKLESLPVIPDHFDLKPIEDTAPRLKLLQKLIQRDDVDELINACDAGREGELIFRYLVRYTGTNKPIRRLWLQSMTPEAIREGFRALRSDQEMQPLANAAVCRSEADWLVGINGTRAMTAFRSPPGGFQLTTVGRVQTPTLAIVVDREKQIRNFVPRPFWEVHAEFETGQGRYTGVWFDEKFSKQDQKKDPDRKPERIWDQAQAEQIVAAVRGQEGTAEDQSRETTKAPPLLFDLTSLQREANNRFGFSAQRTLAIAQSLYERHKVLTYPRTDSRALPEDYIPTVQDILRQLRDAGILTPAIDKVLQNGWVRPNRRIFNNARVTDHFAIIPTGVAPKGLSEAEQRIFDLVLKRFLAAFYPPARFLETTRITRVAGHTFRTQGRILLEPGWMEVYGREQDGQEKPELPPLADPPTVRTEEVHLESKTTKPPSRFTEATLLSAMEGAGKLVEDEELRAAMAEKGLGTPATRAQIIENLIDEKYLVRRGKELVPTDKAFELMELLQEFQIQDLTRPELTGEWEYKLKRMERNELEPHQFMEEIRTLVHRIVDQIRAHATEERPIEAPCPVCGGSCIARPHDVECTQCDWQMRRTLFGRTFRIPEIEELLRNRRVGPLEGFLPRKKKSTRPFTATVVLDESHQPRLEFGPSTTERSGEGSEATTPDLSQLEAVGPCPLCGGTVYALEDRYACENALNNNGSCRFRLSRTILQRALEPKEVQELLVHRRVGPLEGFVSRRGRRRFRAILILQDDGELKFEFPEAQEAGGRRSPAARRAAALEPEEPEKTPENLEQLETVATCPLCGGRVVAWQDHYVCENRWNREKPCSFRIARVLCERSLTEDELRQLIEEKRLGPLEGFVSRNGRPFTATLVLTKRGTVQYDFGEGTSRRSRTRRRSRS